VRVIREFFLVCKWNLLTLLAATAISFPVSAGVVPSVVATCGYINPTPLTEHTTHTFNSKGASTLVVYLSSHPVWNGKNVSFEGITDSTGNKWKLLAGPTTWDGRTFTLMSAIYYVNAPITQATHSLTVHLTNPSPLVVHIFAVSGTDITTPPLASPIVSVLDGKSSSDVLGTAINVPADTLLLGWAKNETNATVTALDGFTLDSESTSFLWGESETVHKSGSYTSHFHYGSSIGWQTAVVGLIGFRKPVASNEAFITAPHSPVQISLDAASSTGAPLTWKVLTKPAHGTLLGSPPTVTYSPDPNYLGLDGFKFKVLEGTSESNTAEVKITVQGKTFIQRLRESALKVGYFSMIWGVVLGFLFSSRKHREIGFAEPY